MKMTICDLMNDYFGIYGKFYIRKSVSESVIQKDHVATVKIFCGGIVEKYQK